MFLYDFTLEKGCCGVKALRAVCFFVSGSVFFVNVLRDLLFNNLFIVVACSRDTTPDIESDPESYSVCEKALKQSC